MLALSACGSLEKVFFGGSQFVLQTQVCTEISQLNKCFETIERCPVLGAHYGAILSIVWTERDIFYLMPLCMYLFIVYWALFDTCTGGRC
jgi:hypothetical protein